MGQHFDPITIEILWRRLISIVDEADSAVSRTAFSSLLRDAHDYTCMFTDRKGRELAQGSFATPGQSGAMALGIKTLVTRTRASDSCTIRGTSIITNDPWALAGHLKRRVRHEPDLSINGKPDGLHGVRFSSLGYRWAGVIGQPRRV